VTRSFDKRTNLDNLRWPHAPLWTWAHRWEVSPDAARTALLEGLRLGSVLSDRERFFVRNDALPALERRARALEAVDLLDENPF
jgi:hypothetical protein